MPQKSSTTKTAVAVSPPGYELPDKLEKHSSAISGSEFASVCQASATFIRELLAERTNLRVELIRLDRAMQRIKELSGG